MSYLLTKKELNSIIEAIQYNNSTSVQLAETRLKNIYTIVKNGIDVDIETSGIKITNPDEFKKWMDQSFAFKIFNTTDW